MDRAKILVVDDESRMRKLVRDFLVREGYNVLEAEDGVEAMDIFYEEKDISLLILDVMMPRMNGLDAARIIREMKRRDARRVPIIAISANSFAEDIINSRMAGMNVHLAKPLDAEKMIVALKQCMADNSDVKLHEDL